MVNIHNIMEEQVITRVNKLYDQVKEKGSAWLTCDCENCRMDTVSYVLNRIPPRYVVSGRGVTHNTRDLSADNQLVADIDQLGVEGMRLVSSAKRPFHKSTRENFTAVLDKPVFNFPTFLGNVFDGQTFEPLSGVNILLKLNGKPAEMMDITWPNPCNTFQATQGSYSFWCLPVPSEKEGEARTFDFTLDINADGYQSVTFSFSVPVTSEKIDRREVNSTFSLNIQDIFLFKEGVVNEQE